MSQAVIDFCEGLKSTLLALEDRLAKAKTNLDASATSATAEAKKQIDEAVDHLARFKTHAGLMAQAIRADLPNQKAVAEEKLKELGLEAQVALRHAVVFLAENASEALQTGAKSAQRVADSLKHETAVATTGEQAKPPA